MGQICQDYPGGLSENAGGLDGPDGQCLNGVKEWEFSVQFEEVYLGGDLECSLSEG